MAKLINKLMLFYINEDNMEESVRNAIKEIVKLSDAEKESFVNYVQYNWIEYTKSILNENYDYVRLTTIVYDAWKSYRNGM